MFIKETFIQSFDKLKTNAKELIPFVVSLSNALLSEIEGHEWNQLVQGFLNVKGKLTVWSNFASVTKLHNS
jgi:hypothetical protein